MDLPNGRVVYALLSRLDNPEYATYVTGPALGPHIPHVKSDANFLDEIVSRRGQMLTLQGAYDLPRTVTYNPSHREDYKPAQTWPMFVAFDDLSRPASVHEVSPESLGVRAITIAITDDPVSKTISAKLPWLSKYRGERRSLSGDASGVVTSNDPKDVLGTGAFIQGGTH